MKKDFLMVTQSMQRKWPFLDFIFFLSLKAEKTLFNTT